MRSINSTLAVLSYVYVNCRRLDRCVAGVGDGAVESGRWTGSNLERMARVASGPRQPRTRGSTRKHCPAKGCDAGPDRARLAAGAEAVDRTDSRDDEVESSGGKHGCGNG